MLERNPSKVDPSTAGVATNSANNRHNAPSTGAVEFTSPISSINNAIADAAATTPLPVENQNHKVRDRDKSPIRSNARLLFSTEITRELSSNSLSKMVQQSEGDSLKDMSYDSFDAKASLGVRHSSNSNSNCNSNSSSNNGSSVLYMNSNLNSSSSSSQDDLDTVSNIMDINTGNHHGLSGGSNSNKVASGSSPPTGQSFQSPIFKLVPLRRMGAVVKEDDADDLTPSINFRNTALHMDSGGLGSLLSSASGKFSGAARPSTVNAVMGSSKRNGLQINQKNNSSEAGDADDTMSCGSSPGMERFSTSRFLTASSSRKSSYNLSNGNGSSTVNTNGKLVLNTNYQELSTNGNNGTGSGYTTYGNSSNVSSKRQPIADSFLSPSVSSSKRDALFNHELTSPGTASSS